MFTYDILPGSISSRNIYSNPILTLISTHNINLETLDEAEYCEKDFEEKGR